MTAERGSVEPLEQRFISPGHWLIEGHDVRHGPATTTRRRPRWRIEFCGKLRARVWSLPLAREWIRDHREDAR